MFIMQDDQIDHSLTAGGLTAVLDPVTAILRVNSEDGTPLARLRVLSSVDTTDGVDEVRVQSIRSAGESAEDRRLVVAADSSCWDSHETTVRPTSGALEISTVVRGSGRIAAVQQLGARSSIGKGVLVSDLLHRSVFVPNPDRPWRVFRSAEESAVLGVVGDGGEPGVGRWLFTPPPLCIGLSPDGDGTGRSGPWLMIGVAAVRRPFTQLAYDAVAPGFSLRYDYDGQTATDGAFETPTLLLFTADDPETGLKRYRELLDERGLIPARRRAAPTARWHEPMFCGWGAQNADAKSNPAPQDAGAWATQDRYDAYLSTLDRHGIRPGTVVVDDKWQQAYATCTPDPVKWPDMAAWIRTRHQADQRVLLWYKAWDTEGAPPEACVRDRHGRSVAIDPESVAGRRLLRQAAQSMIGDLDADGVKIDFTASTPAGVSLVHAGSSWGIDLLHELLSVLYDAITEIKPDALVITHAPDPTFADVTDMLRLNDVMMLDQRDGGDEPAGTAPGQAVVDEMRFRAGVVRATNPETLIDTDGWVLPNLDAYAAWTALQGELGVPSLYYADRLDGILPVAQVIPDAVLRATGEHWSAYRQRISQR